MADENAAAPDGAADQQTQEAPRLLLHSQFLQDLSFENPNGARSFTQGELSPQVQVSLNVDSRKLGETTYEVALKITADAKQNDEPCFLVEVDYRGVFSLTGAEPNVAQAILMIEGPRTIFPFARRIVADAARDGGFPPLMLEPVDFANIYRRRLAEQTAAGANGGDGEAPASPATE